MKDFIILTDSTSDMTAQLRQEYGVEYVPMNYIIDGIEYKASLDWESHDPKQYYDLMRGGCRVFTTQIPRDVYEKAFREPAPPLCPPPSMWPDWSPRRSWQKIPMPVFTV